MSKRAQVHLSSVVLAAVLIVVAGFFLLVFYVPYLAALWQEQARALSVFERLVVSTGQAAQLRGFLLPGLLAALLTGAIVWRVVAQVQWSRKGKPVRRAR